MNKTMIATGLIAASLTAFAGSASASQMLVYGTDVNGKKVVEVVQVTPGTPASASFAYNNEIELPGSMHYGGRQLLIVPNTDNNGASRIWR